jgi:hypothetical protein
MRSRSTLDLGLGVLHLDVLQARLRRKRRPIRMLLLVSALLGVVAMAQPYLSAWWVGEGTLALIAAPSDAQLALDGNPFSGVSMRVLSGTHSLTYRREGYYAATLSVTVTRDQTTTLTLPTLRPRPIVQPIPLPSVGSAWQAAAPDGSGGWRLTATTADARPTPAPYGSGPRDSASPRTLLHLDSVGLTRLAALEAYSAADERTAAEGRSWAAYETRQPVRGGWQEAAGRLTIRWPAGSTVLTPTAPISGLWWAPDGLRLLIAIDHGAGQDLVFWSPSAGSLDAPIVTVPGQIVAVQWHPSGRAAVVLSTRQPSRAASLTPDTPPTWDATLVLAAMRPMESARALRLATPLPAPLALVPLAWQDEALLWITAPGSVWELQRVPFSAALPTRLGPVPAGTVALRADNANRLRLLVQADGMLTLRDWVSGATVLTLDDVPIDAGMSAAWQDNTLLVATEQELWYLTFSPAALR